MNKLQQYARNVAVAFDQFINALAGGDEDETLSSRLGKGRRKGLKAHTVMANITDWLFAKLFKDFDHCNRSIEKIEKNDALID